MVDITIRSEANLDNITTALKENGFEVARELIPVDIIIWTDSEPIAAERKDCSDFIRSIKDGSIWDQLTAMENITTRNKSYILLEDYEWYFKLRYTKFNRHAIVAAAHSISKRAIILPTLSSTHTYEWIQDRLEEILVLYPEKNYIKLRASASKWPSQEEWEKLTPDEKTVYLARWAQYVVEGFPGIGGDKSEKIRRNSDSLWHFMEMVNYKTEKANKFIPQKIVQKIKEVSMAPWKINNE